MTWGLNISSNFTRLPGKHDTFNQCRANVSQRLQRCPNINFGKNIVLAGYAEKVPQLPA